MIEAAADQPHARGASPGALPTVAAAAAGNSPGMLGRAPVEIAAGVDGLPGYARSLLRIRVPLVVTLAAKKMPIGRIIELGPGSIIQFDKPYEDDLQVNVGSLKFAEGEAVKVGDKFGIRLTTFVPPGECIQSVRSR